MYNQAQRKTGMSRMDETIQAKTQKRQELEKLGVIVHPHTFNKQHTIAQTRELMDQAVQTAGRIMSIRAHGKVVFLDLQDSTANIQVMVRQSEVSEQEFEWLKTLVDRGDYLGVSGTIVLTKTNEITILASEVTLLGKALRPIPTAFNAADNKETRFRKRYVDMLINPETKRVLDARWLIQKEVRRFLQDRYDFVEVETPILQPLYGGTNATPFTTHMNALDCNFYLRIAPELYLKRLIVGGYDKVFEIARNFRNEGIDQTHQPEFTMIEWYETYADYHRMMNVAEEMVKHLVYKLYGNHEITVGETTIDIGDDWPRIRMDEALKQYASIDFESLSDTEVLGLLAQHHITLKSEFTRGKALFELFDALVTPQLLAPIWIVDYPRDISPLAKQHRTNPLFAERFEAYIGGKELADGWSEIVDPIDQRNIWENEQANMRHGDTEAHPLDEDFLEAMEHGMPPLGGIGIGIDRLVMFLTNTWSIKEVIAFPTLKPINPLQLTENVTPNFTAEGIQPEVSKKFPGISYAQVIIEGVSIKKTTPELEQMKKTVLETKENITLEDISKISSVAAYRSLLKDTGTDASKKRPSPEALLRRIALGKNLYTINSAADAYNLAVIETGIGLGGFDADKLSLPVSLRFSKAGEKMLLLGDAEATTAREGQLVYADKEKPLTIDLNYRDINETKLTEKTTRIALYADGAPGIETKKVIDALQLGAQYIQKFCGGTIKELTFYDEKGMHTPSETNNSSNGEMKPLPPRAEAEALLNQYISDEALKNHCRMVARAMAAYAEKLGQDSELWYQAGLLHDLDWEQYPDEHPNRAINEILTHYPQELLDAIAAHGPERTGKYPETPIERYLFACDEISGFINAVSILRPEKFVGMTPKSVKKKLKTKGFAANVSREDIAEGLRLINSNEDEHFAFLIGVFNK